MKCPYCAGEIDEGVLKCKHCSEWIDPEWRVAEYKLKQSQANAYSIVRLLGWTILIIIAVIFLMAHPCRY